MDPELTYCMTPAQLTCTLSIVHGVQCTCLKPSPNNGPYLTNSMTEKKKYVVLVPFCKGKTETKDFYNLYQKISES